MAAVAETAAVTLVNGASRAGNNLSMQRPSIQDGRAVQGPACDEETSMETLQQIDRPWIEAIPDRPEGRTRGDPISRL